MRLAVVLFNLGGPDRLEAVRPFLSNLFSDPAIIRAPGFVRRPLARFIAERRAPVARKIYSKIGGRSPILPETELQARALEAALARHGHDAKCFIAMRYWHPSTGETAGAVKAFAPERIVLLPLYPQYSTTTTGSSRDEWERSAAAAKLDVPTSEICCYPAEGGFIAALTSRVREALSRTRPDVSYRLLFSAHGLPKRIVDGGDPYRWQVERTVEAALAALDKEGLDWSICFQSRVGPLEWIGPATEAEVRRAGAGGKGVVMVPVAFVSEHSETLVELDIEYAELARRSGVPDYIRAGTVRDHPEFIAALAGLVAVAINAQIPVSCVPGRLCPARRICGQERRQRRKRYA